MTYRNKIVKDRLPNHIAIIMDGNGRWAQKKGNQRIFGHRNAVQAVRDTVEGAAELGIGFLTLYAFSTENWNRPKTEVDALMALLVSTIHSELKTLQDNNVRLAGIGDLNSLPSKVQSELNRAIESTSKNTGLTLVLALSYSSHWEIIEAAKKIAIDAVENKLSPENIDSVLFKKYLTTSEIPDPDLLIRTSGEFRISNFLLFQIAYSELYFTETLWPDFRREDLYKAICDFQKRERRYGNIVNSVNK